MRFTAMRTQIKPTILVALAFIFLAGCGTPYLPVSDPDFALSLETVKIKAPPGEGWDYFTEDEDGWDYVVFLRGGATPSHHYGAEVAEVDRPADLEEPSQMMELVIRPVVNVIVGDRKIDITRADAVPDTRFSELGVRVTMEAKDYEAPGRGDAEYLITRRWGYAFVHPEQSDTVVVITMNERGLAEEFDAESEAVAEAFFGGLELR